MSLGINVLLELAKIGARSLNGFDIEIIEKHHNKKLDAPSGTTYIIADVIKEEREQSVYNFGRHGNSAGAVIADVLEPPTPSYLKV